MVSMVMRTEYDVSSAERHGVGYFLTNGMRQRWRCEQLTF